jgi:transposase
MVKALAQGINAAGVGVTEGGRRPTGVTPTPARPLPAEADGLHQHPNPEVPEKPVRRRFPASYKLAVLQEADACTQYGQLGELLRREGLYSSHLTTWRQQREQGALEALNPKKRGRKTTRPDPLIQQLQRENARLAARLRQAETILEIQKKASEILGIPLKNLDNGEYA